MLNLRQPAEFMQKFIFSANRRPAVDRPRNVCFPWLYRVGLLFHTLFGLRGDRCLNVVRTLRDCRASRSWFRRCPFPAFLNPLNY